ncbi:uncharacterized protein BDZ99DRAFT_519768 [Mytilinidion resinicola]|uniref:Uncharacterized protein n=1 Tax=Mytilinidion resinicola TaxID=574789 RepID=A0A6A6YST4_9PEZI|nr:uncharacterized protein BDZ99DRAFT_519768 [Mytilinidion resinicola]KAF2811104.1 hypothetical protein BDZ99DRAFT_519768 [Mytilinidion resinicola]
MFVSAVRTILLCEGQNEERYYELLQLLSERLHPAKKRDDTLVQFTAARNRQAETAYLESSGMLASMLTQAFKKLPNLQKIFVVVPRKRYYGIIDPDSRFQGCSVSHIVPIALSASAMADVKLEEFSMRWPVIGDNYGASVQALQVGIFRDRFLCLKKLDIHFSAKDLRVKAPEILSSTSAFLSEAVSLTELKLSFDDWESTDRISESIANNVSLDKLRVVALEGIRFRAQDIIKFLKTHSKSIREVRLQYCSISIGSWLQVLQSLKFIEDLETLHITRTDLQGFFVAFPSTGDISFSPPLYNDEIADWVRVTGPSKYCVLVEYWEDMPAKLQELECDIVKIAVSVFLLACIAKDSLR